MNDSGKKILAQCAKLAVFLTEINEENIQWLVASAKHLGEDRDFSYPFFIEYLDRLKDRGDDLIRVGKNIASLFLEMLNTFTPDYDAEHIKSIVEHLYQLNDPELKIVANQICDIYASRGKQFLRDIYSRYN